MEVKYLLQAGFYGLEMGIFFTTGFVIGSAIIKFIKRKFYDASHL